MISVCAVPELRPWRLSASATGLVSLIGQLLAHEKQAAEELGQWTEKRDVSGDAAAALMIKNLNLGRQRVVEEKKAALARGEIWCE
jgi:hypothetical protein